MPAPALRGNEDKIIGQNDNVVLLSSEALIEHVKEERERLVKQIMQSEMAIIRASLSPG
jgi:hypothetical protein